MTTTYEEIAKDIAALKSPPNMPDYEALRASFSWDDVRAELDLPNGVVNIAHECVDRHAARNPSKTAMIWEGANGSIETYTFEDMRRESAKFASVLASLGVRKGERVFFLMDRVPELYFAVFGTLRRGAIVCPLFSAFGPDPIAERINRAEGCVVVTSPTLYPKIEAVRERTPSVRQVIVIGDRAGRRGPEGTTVDYATLMASAPEAPLEPTGNEDWAVIHFTSGTTGLPKGGSHVHGAVLGHYATGKYVQDLQADDIYWCTADPGWVTGTSYGMFAPWSNGTTSLIYEGGFSSAKWFELIQRHRVTVWYTAPTAIRLLMKAGLDIPRRFDLSSLRYTMSVGEPLNPEGVVWGLEAFGLPFHDNWWQTETGAIMIANYPSVPIRPGSMGKPFPGVHPAIIDDEYHEISDPDIEGQLAIRVPWPSMMRTYWNDQERYDSRFKDAPDGGAGWYITGDRARKDADGYFWFVGRDDDVINTAGHLVGPFEVESVLIEHPAVAEAGVIGKPDPVAMEVVKAFVALNDGYEWSDLLRRELIGHARARLGPGVAPREIDCLDHLPKTRSGKIMRRLLKARELGLPEGDTSTLEED